MGWELNYHLGQAVRVRPDSEWLGATVSKPPAPGFGVWCRVTANGFEVLIDIEDNIAPA